MEGFDATAFWWGYTMVIAMGVTGGMLAAWALRFLLRLTATATVALWKSMTTQQPWKPTESSRKAQLKEPL